MQHLVGNPEPREGLEEMMQHFGKSDSLLSCSGLDGKIYTPRVCMVNMKQEPPEGCATKLD